ncbi:MAG: Asp-tRNA(Asn)/Glu-tRNA(Gln) amidotransferase subunit GatC [Candidatus Vecturithrix sp.]|jgi:aspartyl-tRNA(Asn)/glutamyl-tRNA(Gln) amidotransferase subunit C|nr:Asp-tRNA(Asn)/Glu-tRNA(Gln) amidotransferase subunit GatC [Candidatus Vecturithrix sp.]
MKISEDDVRYVAKLARLQLDSDQVQQMSETFNDILTYMDTLNHVNTTAVLPTSHVVKMENVLRNDEVKASLPLEDALQNAPDRIGAYYRVPKIIE